MTERINEHYYDFAVYGGYPRVILSKSKKEKDKVLENIYDTYLLREINEILHLPDDFKVTRLMKVLSLQASGIANYNEISSSSGLRTFRTMSEPRQMSAAFGTTVHPASR